MKTKEFTFSIIINGFLGYLWILFVNHIYSFANTMNNALIVKGIIVVFGSVLFAEFFKRINPFNKNIFTHPGFISFVGVVAIHLFLVELV